MYDIEFVVPISFKNKYFERIKDFKNLGLLNIQNNKVLITFLIGTEKVPDYFFDDWNCDIRTISSDSDFHVCKVCDYYLNLDPNKLNSRWIAKIDDDSVNDVSSLVKNLDDDFNHEKEYNVITNYKDDLDGVEYKILKSMGYDNWINSPKKTIIHELECNILSIAALKEIILNKKSIEYLSKRKSISSGYTDQAISIVAKIAKIPATSGWFLSNQAEVGEFSLFKGWYSHIHFVSRERNESKLNFLYDMINSDRNSLKEKDFAYYVDNNPIDIVRFDEAGRINVRRRNNTDEIFWCLKDKDLIVFNKNGERTACYSNFLELIKDKKECYGRFSADIASIPCLKAVG